MTPATLLEDRILEQWPSFEDLVDRARRGDNILYVTRHGFEAGSVLEDLFRAARPIDEATERFDHERNHRGGLFCDLAGRVVVVAYAETDLGLEYFDLVVLDLDEPSLNYLNTICSLLYPSGKIARRT
jgi:hypothetical protein